MYGIHFTTIFITLFLYSHVHLSYFPILLHINNIQILLYIPMQMMKHDECGTWIQYHLQICICIFMHTCILYNHNVYELTALTSSWSSQRSESTSSCTSALCSGSDMVKKLVNTSTCVKPSMAALACQDCRLATWNRQ